MSAISIAAMPAMRRYMAVAIGSALGGAARWSVASALEPSAATFPWTTLVVNTSGSFAIGIYAALVLARTRFATGAWQREFVVTGFLGGYTTFSIFSLESIELIESGQASTAAAYVGVSVLSWLACVWFGFAVGERLQKRRARR
jgi:fluoride exporter